MDGVAIPDPSETPGWHLIEAIEYWGISEGGLPARECKAIAEIEGFGQDEAKDLRELSLAFLDGYRRGDNPLGALPPYEVEGHE